MYPASSSSRIHIPVQVFLRAVHGEPRNPLITGLRAFWAIDPKMHGQPFGNVSDSCKLCCISPRTARYWETFREQQLHPVVCHQSHICQASISKKIIIMLYERNNRNDFPSPKTKIFYLPTKTRKLFFFSFFLQRKGRYIWNPFK